MTSIKKLQNLAKKCQKIAIEELKKSNVKYDSVDARIFDCGTTGVQGDERSYAFPAEVAIYYQGGLVINHDLNEKISTRITNEIRNINRVTYRLHSI